MNKEELKKYWREHRKKYREENKEEIGEYDKKYRETHKEKIRERAKKHDSFRRNKAKDSAFEILGRQCNRCGFSDTRALQIDHINGGGSKDRKTGGTHGIYKKIIELGESAKEKYQVLCANCNWIKRVENKEFSRSNSKA